MRHRRRKSGFVLLMVLVVLAISATFLASAARRSCDLALRAGSSHQQLQVKWGTLSCQAACLPAAERFLERANQPGQDPVREVRRSVALGGVKFHLILSDEQAKANVNRLVRHRGDTTLPSILRKLQIDRRRPLPVRLRPGQASPAAPERGPAPQGPAGPEPAPYASFEQLFAFTHPSELAGPTQAEESVVSRVTCWGSGRLNFRRAETAVLREALAGILTETEIAKLGAFRRGEPECTLAKAVEHLALSKDKAKALDQAATEASQCHGLWVIAQGPTRSWYSFHIVATRGGGADAGGWTLTW